MSKDLISKAEEHLKKGEPAKAAAGFVEAARAFAEGRDSGESVRCYRKAADLLEKSEKAECLLEGWRVLITAIAGAEWECNFEFKGDEGHDDDHEFNQSYIGKLVKKAEAILRDALNVEGANPKKILKLARKECERRKKADGWGAKRGFAIIERVAGK
jgi:hypothetical protein